MEETVGIKMKRKWEVIFLYNGKEVRRRHFWTNKGATNYAEDLHKALVNHGHDEFTFVVQRRES